MTDCLHKNKQIFEYYSLNYDAGANPGIIPGFQQHPKPKRCQTIGMLECWGEGAVRYLNCTFVNFERKNNNNNFRITFFLYIPYIKVYN